MKRSFIFFITTIALCIALNTTSYSAELAIHGSTTVYTNIFKKQQSSIETKSNIKLNILANGTARGIIDLLNGKTDMAMISSSLETAIAQINKSNPGTIAKGILTGHKIGETKIAFIVHKSNPVLKLTLGQIKNILQGKIRNWSQVGGKNKPILVISEDTKGGIRTLVEKKLLGSENINAPNHKEVFLGQEVVKVTIKSPNAFGISTAELISDKIKAIQTDTEISQPLILVSKGKATPLMNKVIAAAKSVAKKK